MTSPAVADLEVFQCPGFGWDGVNFHRKPGGDTAGMADPDWPYKRDIL